MKCEKCGYTPNPGDQICLNCGARLSLNNAVIPEVEQVNDVIEKKNNKQLIILFAIVGLVLVATIIFLIINFI